jgi:ribokinase
MPKITVIGSSNTDMVVKTNKVPAPGETVIGGEFFMFSGGKGANQAVAAARMGGEVTFVGRIGNDIFGQRALSEFMKEGMETRYVSTDPDHASGTAMILVNGEGENEIVVVPGANATLTEKELHDAKEAVHGCDILLMQLEIPLNTVLQGARMAYAFGHKVILNPAPAQSLPKDLYPLLHLITPNETEAEILTGIKLTDTASASAAASQLLDLGVGNVIITMGAKGVFFKGKDLEMSIPAPFVTAVDTTAAGDVFNGALAVELASGMDWKAAMTSAVKAASWSVTRMGAQASMPYRVPEDVAQITPVTLVPEALVAHPGIGAKTLPELLELARRKPGSLNIGTAGGAGISHLTAYLFKSLTGAQVEVVLYRGAAPAITDLVGGQIQLLFADLPPLLPHIKANAIVPLALAARKRSPTLPDLPTTGEYGFPKLLAENWYCAVAPRGTPQPILDRLSAAYKDASEQPALREALQQQGAQAHWLSMADFARFIAEDSAVWRDVVKTSGVKFD